MVVVGCCVVPSWPGVLDLDLADLPDTCHQLHVAAKYIGDHVHDLRPDMIVLVSHRYICCSAAVTAGFQIQPFQGEHTRPLGWRTIINQKWHTKNQEK